MPDYTEESREAGRAAGERPTIRPVRERTTGAATRKRPPTLTSDNQITPKPNFALNAEMKAVAERLTLPAVLVRFFRFAPTAIE